MPKTYQRLKPEDYAARRLALRLKVQEGLPVETAARILNLPRSTARLWAAQDGFRLKDLEAEAAGAARPEVGGWAKTGRRRAAAQTPPAEADEAPGLPPAEYPELQGLGPRARLRRLYHLAGQAELRAVSAIEEGCVTYALGALREAQRLRRAWRALNDWGIGPADAGEPEGFPEDDRTDPQDWAEVFEAIEAVEAAHFARRGLTPEDLPEEDAEQCAIDMLKEAFRQLDIREKWMALPGRTPPPVRVQLPDRWWRRPEGAAEGGEAGEAAAGGAREAAALARPGSKASHWEAFPVVVASHLRRRE